MSNHKQYIVGSGITGLIWKFYNPEYQIISPESPGTFAKSHLVWLHDTPFTRQLVKDLGFQIKTKRSYIGYYVDCEYSNKQTTTINRKVIQKKMTNWDEPINKKFKIKSKQISLNTEKDESFMNVLDVDLVELISRLQKNADVEQGLVTRITDNEISVTKENKHIKYKYDRLITTMPAPFFWKAYSKDMKFKSTPITNVIVKKNPGHHMQNCEMMYYSDKNIEYSRTSFLDGVYAIEFTGVVPEEHIRQKYSDLEIISCFVIQHGRIEENLQNVEPNDKIVFSGRFAKWKFGITTEHVVELVINNIKK